MLTLANINLIQRDTAIIALGLLAVQLYFNNSKRLLNYFVYLFIFIQPILVILYKYIYNSHFDPFYMYTDVCALCGGKAEYAINFLRIAFYSVTLSIFAPLLKNESKWLKKNWKYLEYFSFVGFYSLSLYLYNSGPVIKPKLFILFFWLCQIVVVLTIVSKIKPLLLKAGELVK